MNQEEDSFSRLGCRRGVLEDACASLARAQACQARGGKRGGLPSDPLVAPHGANHGANKNRFALEPEAPKHCHPRPGSSRAQAPKKRRMGCLRGYLKDQRRAERNGALALLRILGVF